MTRLGAAETPSPRQQAIAAVEHLKQVLAAHRIALPSLGLDVPSYAPFSDRPLIELGRCNVDTCRALTAALNGQPKETER
jgi:hypothetical protein